MPSPRRAAPAWIPALVLALLLPLLAACGGSDEPDAAQGPVATAPADGGGRPVGLGATITAEDLTARYADLGVVTYAEAGDTEPVAPVTEPGAVALTSWQVRNQVLQLNEVRGYRTEDLADLVQTEGVPFGAVLAAWARDAETPGAALARELMGEQDWARDAATLVWPDAALTLFVNDLATDAEAGPARIETAAATGGSLVVVPALAARRAGLCSDLQNLLTSALDTIVSNLQVAPSDGVGGVLGAIWNGVVQIAADAFEAAVEALTAPFMKIVRGAATVLAVLSSASALLDPWTIEITLDHPTNHYSYGSVPDRESTFTTSVTSGLGFTWPDDVVDCAAAAGVVLPDPGSAAGSPVTWVRYPNGAEVTVTREDPTLDKAGTAQFRIRPGTETIDQHENGQEVMSPYGVGVEVRRTAVDKMIDLVKTLLLDTLPVDARPLVAALLGPVEGSVRTKLASMTQASSKANVFVDITHHLEPTQTPSPVATTDPAPDCEGVDGVSAVPDGTWEGPIELDVLGTGNGVSMNSAGGGQMRIVVEDGKVVGGPWSIDFTSKGNGTGDGVEVRLDLVGTLAGTVSGTASAPVASGSSTLTGTAKATAMGITQDVPIDESGSIDDTLTVESTSCDEVTATWLPSFSARTNPAGISLEGTARWVGTRVG